MTKNKLDMCEVVENLGIIEVMRGLEIALEGLIDASPESGSVSAVNLVAKIKKAMPYVARMIENLPKR